MTSLIPFYEVTILNRLKAGPATPAELEADIAKRFGKHWTTRDKATNGAGILQWRNDVHHARRQLTQARKIVTGAGLVRAVPEDLVVKPVKVVVPKRAKEPKPDDKALFANLTADVLAALKSGKCLWRRPWGSINNPRQVIDFAPLELPCNAKTGKPYYGVNTLCLWNAIYQAKGALTESLWGTEKTWGALGASVLRGERYINIRFMHFKDKEEKEDELIPIWHRVYNLDQVGGCDHLRRGINPVLGVHTEGEINTERAMTLVRKAGAKVAWGGNTASYTVRTDSIRMPDKRRFPSELDVITVLLHEMGHWTGHPSRLKRIKECPINTESPEYAFEELVAELTCCFTLASLKIPDRYAISEHAGYIKGYIKLLETDPRARQRAAGKAGAATRYLLNLLG